MKDNKNKFTWQNCMSIKRQYPANVARQVNTKEAIKDIINIPQFPDTSKENKSIRKGLLGNNQTPSEILESVFRPEDGAKKKWKRVFGAIAAQEKVEEEAEPDAKKKSKHRF